VPAHRVPHPMRQLHMPAHPTPPLRAAAAAVDMLAAVNISDA
jgi:hypothetical protein